MEKGVLSADQFLMLGSSEGNIVTDVNPHFVVDTDQDVDVDADADKDNIDVWMAQDVDMQRVLERYNISTNDMPHKNKYVFLVEQ